MKEKINLRYGDKVAVFPCAALDYVERASKLNMKILICAVSCAKMGQVDVKEVMEFVGATEDQINSALAFWEKAGIFISDSVSENVRERQVFEPETDTEKRAVTVIKRSDEVPTYTSGELSKILEKRVEASHFIDECQRRMGKMFNTHDINVILALVDYMGFEWDYVLAVVEYCGKIGKRSAKYAEKVAISMNEKGIETVDELKTKFEELEILAENESKIRRLFGLKARALTEKEKKFIEAWFGKFGYSIDIVNRAYEITVNATGEASLPYAHAILERWNSEGLRTLEEIDAAIENKKKESAHESTGSFDTDDFFEAALKRSFADKN